MTPETLSILANKDVIAIDQDPMGKQGDRVHSEGPLEVWARPLAGGAKAVGLFNLGDRPANMEITFTAVGLKGPAKTRDVWAGADLGKLKSYHAVVPGPRGGVAAGGLALHSQGAACSRASMSS